ncbi:MAG TPA: triose-phosphate isomerase [Chlamydiales bacterium]|nr:triose-phosphate isomerase [Chlamydiales bacterium]
MSREQIIAGNWKMYKTTKEAVDFIENLKSKVGSSLASIYLAVPFTMISETAKAAEGTNIIIGAQNMNDATEGAFTGEIAGIMLKDAGAEFVLLGHSERRHIFKESNEFIQKKLERALKDDLQPILCIGETQEERDSEKTEEVLETQIKTALKNVSEKDMEKVVVAYEPVWAIGTGKTATPEIAEKAHAYIRKVLKELYGKTISDKISILYGGSVKPANIEALMNEKNIDGALIGGASLDPDTFAEVINKC